METTQTQPAEQPAVALTAEEQFDRQFKPNGAIAFFILLIIVGMVIWFGIYFLMLSRA